MRQRVLHYVFNLLLALVAEPLEKQHPNIQHLHLGVSTLKSVVLELFPLQIQGEKNSAGEGGDRKGEGGGVHATSTTVSGRDEDGSGEAEKVLPKDKYPLAMGQKR